MKYLLILFALFTGGCGNDPPATDHRIEYLMYVEERRSDGFYVESYEVWKAIEYGTPEERTQAYEVIKNREVPDHSPSFLKVIGRD